MIFNEREVTRNEKGKPREKREEWFQMIWGHFPGIFEMFLFNFQVVIFVDFETFLTWPVLLFYFIFYFFFLEVLESFSLKHGTLRW